MDVSRVGFWSKLYLGFYVQHQSPALIGETTSQYRAPITYYSHSTAALHNDGVNNALIPLPDVGATLQSGMETSPRTVWLYAEN
jgi:hypothetical protein